jgi:hypothetical protein
MSKINSIEFYTALSTALSVARDEIKLATDDDVYFHIHALHSYKGPQRPTITVTNGKYNAEKVEVEGFALGDLVDEYIRRVRFANGQHNLRLGPPEIDGETSQ